MMENNSHLFTAKFALKIGSQKNSVVIMIACFQTAIFNASSRQEKPKQLLTTSLRQRGRAEKTELPRDLKLLQLSVCCLYKH